MEMRKKMAYAEHMKKKAEAAGGQAATAEVTEAGEETKATEET